MDVDERRRLARVVRQHAQTARLMGVDFVPVFTREESPAGPAAADEVGAAAGVEAEATGAQKANAAPPTPRETGDDRTGAQRRLDEVRERYERDAPHQHFVTAHTNIVFGEGDPRARLMFIGEAPGADEDATGRPFVGRAGQLLNKMIAAMGLTRDEVYITNVLKTRPPNNATPTLQEASRCAPYLYEQIAIVRPEAIVTLGLPATRLILGTDEAMGRLRGRWSEFSHGDVRVPVMPTYHPAYLLRAYTEENRAKVWSDLQMVMQRLGLAAKSDRAMR